MAGKQSSANAWILVDGYDLTAFKPKGAELEDSSIQENTAGLGDTASPIYTPVGVKSLTLAVTGGYYDTTTNSSHDALKSPGSTPQATPRVVAIGLAGHTVGEEFRGISGLYSQSYKVQAVLNELTKANANYVTAGQVEPGQILQPLAAKTADWNTKTLGTQVDFATFTSQRVIPIASATKANPCVVTTSVPHGLSAGNKILIAGNSLSGPDINADLAVTVLTSTTFSVAVNTSGSSGAGTGGSFVLTNTLNGAAGYLQVKACTGFTNFVAKIRHSADDTTYADLITFTDNVVAPFAERKTVSGTIHRYTCVDGDVTGSGSVTPFVGLSRL